MTTPDANIAFITLPRNDPEVFIHYVGRASAKDKLAPICVMGGGTKKREHKKTL